MAINRILLPSGMASGCTFGPSGWSIIDFTLVKIVLWKLLIMDLCFEKHLIFFVLFWFNNIGNYSRLYTHLMTHSRDMFTFFYTWVLLQVVSNQLNCVELAYSRITTQVWPKTEQKFLWNFYVFVVKFNFQEHSFVQFWKPFGKPPIFSKDALGCIHTGNLLLL